jgi:hypothetical protein
MKKTLDTATILSAHKKLADPTATPAEIAECQAMIDEISKPQIGTLVLVKTCTIYTAGVLLAESADWIAIGDPETIPDVGETKNAFQTGQWKAKEDYPDGTIVHISRGAIVDVAVFTRKK